MKNKEIKKDVELLEEYLEVAGDTSVYVTENLDATDDVSDLELLNPDEDIAFMSSTEIPGTEVADIFRLLETGWIYPNTVDNYRITRLDDLPILSSGVISRIYSTLVDGGKLYVLKAIHSDNEPAFEPYFGERVSARGRCITYGK